MDCQAAMTALESLGTEQNRKTYRRHGVHEPFFGVSYADLGKLRKQIKHDQQLACELWRTGNHDARILATMIADPRLSDDALLNTWAADLDNYVLSDALSTLSIAVAVAYERALRWIASDGEWVPYVGWNTLAGVASRGDLPDEAWTPWLARITDTIHAAPNRVRYSMNTALISIGGRSDDLAAQAQMAAARIGNVHVDHGETNCKTPAAAAMITKIRERQAMRSVRS